MRARIEDAGRRLLDVPHDAEKAQHFQDVVRHVVLPPVKPLARAVHEVMVIVVPSFTHRQNREKPIVAAIVVRFVTLISEHVAQRIDRERSVPQEHRAQEKANQERGRTTNQIRRNREHRRRKKPIPIQPYELGVFGQILDAAVIRFLVFRDEQPTDVRIPKSATRIVRIAVLVRQTMVHAVMRSPPKRPFLSARLGQESQNELKKATRFIRAM